VKKFLVVLSVLFILGLVITSCAPAVPATQEPAAPATQEPAAPATQEPVAPAATQPAADTSAKSDVTLKFACWSDTIGTPEAVQKNLIDPFTAKTGIKVDLEILPWGEYWTKLQTLSATGGMPDVYCMSAAYAWEYADKKMAMDLQPLFNQDFKADDYFMPVTDFGWIRYPDSKGDLYAVPFRWVLGGLFYNKDIFDAAGVDYPTDSWTYDDMLAAAQKLTKDENGDGTPDTWGMFVQPDHILYDPMVAANGGSVLDPANKKCNLTEPAALDSLQWIVDAVYKQKVSPPPGLVGAEEGQFKAGVFPSGKVAMVIDGSYNIATWKDLPFKWDVVSQPAGKTGKAVYGGPDSFSIASGTKNPKEAWQFVSHFLSPEIQYKYDVVGIGAVPFLKAAASDPKFYATPGLPEHFNLMVDSNPFIRFTDFGNRWMEWRISIMNNELASAMLGETTPKDAATSACTAITQTLWP
jgi:multiple sugar transport system substrate-binding protein